MEEVKSTGTFVRIEEALDGVDASDVARAVFGRLEIEGSERETRLAEIYGHFLTKEIEPFVAFQSISAINETRCSPPLPPSKISEIVLKVTCSELQYRKRRSEWQSLID